MSHHGQHRARRETSARPLYAVLMLLLGGVLIMAAALVLPAGVFPLHTLAFLAAIVGGMCLAAGIYEATGE